MDTSGNGPLATSTMDDRIGELTKMFTVIKQQHPDIKKVQGGSWLYNYENYRNLFPSEFTNEMQAREKPQTQYMVIWGQFINSENINCLYFKCTMLSGYT